MYANSFTPLSRRSFLKSAAISTACGFFVHLNVARAGERFRRAETFEDAFKASCRVSVDGARGSGAFFGECDGTAYILTNYHVVTNATRARLDFWANGRQESVEGVVDWRYYDAGVPCDFARIAVPSDKLAYINPPWVALGGSDARPSDNAVIISSGAPDGRFVQSWKGWTEGYYNNRTCIFSPPPVPGQSGSAIIEKIDGALFITGILTWLIGEKGRDESKGGAIPIANLYKALSRNPAQNAGIFEELAIPPDAIEC